MDPKITKEIVETVETTVGEATKEIINKGFVLLDQLAAKIGVTTEYLWPFMVKESVVQALSSILLLVTSVIGVLFSCKFVKFIRTEEGGVDLEYAPRAIIAAIVTGILIIGVMAGFCNTWVDLPGLLNPEYHALERLINMVK